MKFYYELRGTVRVQAYNVEHALEQFKPRYLEMRVIAINDDEPTDGPAAIETTWQLLDAYTGEPR